MFRKIKNLKAQTWVQVLSQLQNFLRFSRPCCIKSAWRVACTTRLGPKSQTLSLPEGNYVGEVVDGKQQAFCVIL